MELKETESIKSRLETEHYEKSQENYDLGIIRNIIEGHSTGNWSILFPEKFVSCFRKEKSF